MMAEYHPAVGRHEIFAVIADHGRSSTLVIQHQHFGSQPLAVESIADSGRTQPGNHDPERTDFLALREREHTQRGETYQRYRNPKQLLPKRHARLTRSTMNATFSITDGATGYVWGARPSRALVLASRQNNLLRKSAIAKHNRQRPRRACSPDQSRSRACVSLASCSLNFFCRCRCSSTTAAGARSTKDLLASFASTVRSSPSILAISLFR